MTEVFQSITESTRRKLRKADEPKCNCNVKVTRLIGMGAGVIFKGSGFYETDYRSESYKKGAKAEQEARKPKKDSDGKAGDKSGGTTKSKTTGTSETKTASSKKSETKSSD